MIQPQYEHAAAVLLPLLFIDGEPHILFERRAFTIDAQPGEVSFPGGMHEGMESIEETAVRETAEELLIKKEQIELLGALDPVLGTGRTIYPFIGKLYDYEGSFSKEEVDHIFTVPFSFLQTYEPKTSATTVTQVPADDFPYELIEGGRAYPFAQAKVPMYFYEVQGEIIWGLTGRILHHFLDIVKDLSEYF